MNQCIRLAESMESMAGKKSIEELKNAAIGVVSVLGNLRSVNSHSVSLLYFFELLVLIFFVGILTELTLFCNKGFE